ncbi:hypothetical protein NEIPOLOT_01971 [Neisseria polysaccharea ATCC 43768]|nr:hypothetical protein NEIPOLOT_01971 [Neisseria polysaccharea ATCC 43768]
MFHFHTPLTLRPSEYIVFFFSLSILICKNYSGLTKIRTRRRSRRQYR